MDELFKALGDPTRREILKLLKKKELPAGEVADKFSMSKPSISHHLDSLRQGGLVTSTRSGQQIIYAINNKAVEQAIDVLEGLMSKGKK
ncbi:MAG: Transcriptional repressor SdpR [Bacteroidota bacterium]|jgi:ArsR family transcriptional regulator, arsenate/arsenite/antimonite-responsive transcriptional repressor